MDVSNYVGVVNHTSHPFIMTDGTVSCAVVLISIGRVRVEYLLMTEEAFDTYTQSTENCVSNVS